MGKRIPTQTKNSKNCKDNSFLILLSRYHYVGEHLIKITILSMDRNEIEEFLGQLVPDGPLDKTIYSRKYLTCLDQLIDWSMQMKKTAASCILALFLSTLLVESLTPHNGKRRMKQVNPGSCSNFMRIHFELTIPHVLITFCSRCLIRMWMVIPIYNTCRTPCRSRTTAASEWFRFSVKTFFVFTFFLAFDIFTILLLNKTVWQSWVFSAIIVEKVTFILII